MSRFKSLLLAVVLAAATLFTPVAAQYNATWRNIQGQAVATALGSGAAFQVWNATTIPSSADTAITGTLLADGNIPGASVAFNSSTSVLTIGGLSDAAINASGPPNLVRIIDDGGARVQFTAKMNAATGTAQVVITDTVDAAATQLLQNRPFNATISIQY